MIVNNKPYTNENGWIDDSLLSNHPKNEIDAVLAWIEKNIEPRKTPLKRFSSYGLKHVLEYDIRLYLTNNEFKDAMLMAGYEPVNPDELNWHYRISSKSRAFDRREGVLC